MKKDPSYLFVLFVCFFVDTSDVHYRPIKFPWFGVFFSDSLTGKKWGNFPMGWEPCIHTHIVFCYLKKKKKIYIIGLWSCHRTDTVIKVCHKPVIHWYDHSDQINQIILHILLHENWNFGALALLAQTLACFSFNRSPGFDSQWGQITDFHLERVYLVIFTHSGPGQNFYI